MNLSRGEIAGIVTGALGLLAWVVSFPGYLELRLLGLVALIYLGYRVLKRYMATGEHHRRLSQLSLGLFVVGGLSTAGQIMNPRGMLSLILASLVVVLALIYPGYLAVRRRN